MRRPTVLFAGGGTGGHLFPGIAVAERLGRLAPDIGVHFACSNRPLDAQIVQKAGVNWTPLPVRPLPRRPWEVLGFLGAYVQSKRTVVELIRSHTVHVVVAMGGFVSGPAVAAARRQGARTMLVNLDAVPGKANRWLAGRCDRIYSVYASSVLPDRTQRIAMPLRASSLAPADAAACRQRLGLGPERPVLLVTAGSQGAASINEMMIELVRRADAREALRDWSIVHLAGKGRDAEVREAYEAAGLTAQVMAFTDQMGLCWGAAELAISRAGANSVAEVVANGVPTVFLPYPYHKDQHQRLNARPIVDAEAALMWDDAKDGAANARQLGPGLVDLLRDQPAREAMRQKLRAFDLGDGAAHLAEQIVAMIRQRG